MTFKIGTDEKFACIAFDNIAMDDAMPEAIDLGDGIWVLRVPPVTFDKTWQQWLGSIRSEELAGSNLFLVAKQHSDRPSILDDENQALLKKVDRLFYGILLQGIPEYRNAYRFTGANVGGTHQVRNFGTLNRYFRTEGSKKPKVGPALCKLAKVAMDGLVAVEIDPEFKRLKRGIAALLRGIRERYAEDRIHEFVRALEALIKPQIAKTTRQFIHRCQIFAMANAANAKVLQECYDLRNKVEHMHPFEEALATYPKAQREKVALRRSRQIEALALAVYLKIATSQSHARIFRTDPDIDAFWGKPNGQRVSAWGQRLDLAPAQ